MSNGWAEMNDDTLKLDKLIGHRPLGRILKKEEIAAEFKLIRQAFEVETKSAPDASKFRMVGKASGTHLMKLVTPRAKIGQHLLKVEQKATNEAAVLTPSTDAKLARIAKTIFRPLEVEGHTHRSLVDHIRNPDNLSPTVTKAFAEVFGEEALQALRESLTSPLPDITTLPTAEFPIIYLPRPGGGDLQVTPIAPADSYIRFRDVTEPYFRKQEDGAQPVARGRWHRQHVTTKQQNISSAVGQRRTRFLATMPRVLDRYSAELHRFAHGGHFPRWRDDRVAEAVAKYAALLDQSMGRTSNGYDPEKAYSNTDIREALERRAERLIQSAKEFIDETLADVKREYPEKERIERPRVVAVILNRRWPKTVERDRAQRVLSSDHFRGQLEAASEH